MAHIDLPTDRDVDKAIPEHERSAHTRHVASRIWIPLVLAIAGVVLLIVGATFFGILALLVAVIAAVADRIIRLGIVSQGDRDREDQSRQEMRRTGRWRR